MKIALLILFAFRLTQAQISADFGTTGSIRFGESVAACDSTTQGAVRYESVGMTMRFCDGLTWQTFSYETCALTVQFSAPDFTNLVNQSVSTLVSSDIKMVGGMPGCTMAIKVSGSGSPQYRICDDATCTSVSQTWSSTESVITNNKYVQLRLTSSASANTFSTATLTLGTSLSSWYVRTQGDCTTADPGVGTVCADGSVYIGVNPETGTKTYALACIAGRTLSGATCSGTATSRSWSTVASVNTGVTNIATGETNTTNLVALSNADSPYPAAAFCDSLTQHGQTDWYLPSRVEAQLLVSGCDQIPDVTCTSSTRHWLSTENNATTAFYFVQSGNTGGTTTKTISYGVRCVRKD